MNNIAFHDYFTLEKDIFKSHKEVIKILENLVESESIVDFRVDTNSVKIGLGSVAFWFFHNHKKLETDFSVDFISLRNDTIFQLKDVSKEAFEEKITQEKNRRIQSYELESYCVQILSELKGDVFSVKLTNIGSLDIRIQYVGRGSEFQDSVKKADVVMTLNVHIQNRHFFSSSMMHTVGLQVKTSKFGQENHIKFFSTIPSIHMKEDGQPIDKELLKERLKTIIKKVALLRSVQFLQATVSGQTSGKEFDQFNKKMSFLAGNLAKEIHK